VNGACLQIALEGSQFPQGLKPSIYVTRSGTAEQFAEKLEFRCPAHKGALILNDLRYCLSDHPDTNREFFSKL